MTKSSVDVIFTIQCKIVMTYLVKLCAQLNENKSVILSSETTRNKKLDPEYNELNAANFLCRLDVALNFMKARHIKIFMSKEDDVLKKLAFNYVKHLASVHTIRNDDEDSLSFANIECKTYFLNEDEDADSERLNIYVLADDDCDWDDILDQNVIEQRANEANEKVLFFVNPLKTKCNAAAFGPQQLPSKWELKDCIDMICFNELMHENNSSPLKGDNVRVIDSLDLFKHSMFPMQTEQDETEPDKTEPDKRDVLDETNVEISVTKPLGKSKVSKKRKKSSVNDDADVDCSERDKPKPKRAKTTIKTVWERNKPSETTIDVPNVVSRDKTKTARKKTSNVAKQDPELHKTTTAVFSSESIRHEKEICNKKASQTFQERPGCTTKFNKSNKLKKTNLFIEDAIDSENASCFSEGNEDDINEVSESSFEKDSFVVSDDDVLDDAVSDDEKLIVNVHISEDQMRLMKRKRMMDSFDSFDSSDSFPKPVSQTSKKRKTKKQSQSCQE